MAATVERPRPAAAAAGPAPIDAATDFGFDSFVRGPSLSAEHWAWIVLVAGAFVMRLWDVGQRAMHHDESMHAFYGWTLFKGGGYHYDPMLHGPFQFHAIALMDFLFGAGDATARLTAVICGSLIVLATWWLRPYMGRLGAFIAGVLFTISPSFLYFSRFAREDIYVTCFTYLMVVGMFGWLASRKPRFI
ncbi:MAG: TIGR03663 family protein, partial [Nevskia sp.]|nr:TIGR03663 family protein [Nevskia sp.]